MGKEENPNLILIGMPSAGKSTLGVLVAKALGMNFLDTDILVQTRQGDTLQSLINRHGLDPFLEMEAETVLSLQNGHTVIATGGSVVYSEPAMRHLQRMGPIVHIWVPFEEMEHRLGDAHSRGIARREGQTLLDLYREREPLYARYADAVVRWRAGLGMQEMAECLWAVANHCQQRIK